MDTDHKPWTTKPGQGKTMNESQIAYVKLSRNEWAGLVGGHYIGRVVGDYGVGFEAVPLDGRRFIGSHPFASVEDAFEVLALDFAFHYGEAKVSA